MPSFPLRLCVALILLAPSSAVAFSQSTAENTAAIKATYTKYEYRIPMRDGTKLFIAVYVPKDDSQKYPCCSCERPMGSGRTRHKIVTSGIAEVSHMICEDGIGKAGSR